MRRGQAFDTMMLVISVIVAVAILGLLLGFLGNIGGFGAKASDVIPDLVKQVQQKGFGLQLKENVEFNSGDSLYRRDAIKSAPISETDVIYQCVSGDESCSGSDSPLTIEDTSIVAHKKISLTVAACLNEQDSKYYIFVGKKVEDVRSQAASKCGLQ